MEQKQKKSPDKINEQYILPLLFLLANITVVVWFYLIHELGRSNWAFETYYNFDRLAIEKYTDELKFELVLFSAVLLFTTSYSKYKKRWLLLTITLLHLGALFCFFYLK